MAGLLLTDGELVAALRDGSLTVVPKFSNLSELSATSPVQPSSLDLTIGSIMQPPPEVLSDGEERTEPHKMKSAWIGPGETLVVETVQTITLAPTLAAFGFPPARLSRNAILMTNPGHVDPGFSGKLSFTLINMGRQRYYLEEGHDIVSLLVFRFDSPVQSDFGQRNGDQLRPRSYWGVLNKLSPDFASMGARIKDETRAAIADQAAEFNQETRDAQDRLKQAEERFELSKLWAPMITAAAAAALSVGGMLGIDRYFDGKYASTDSVSEIAEDVDELGTDLEAIGRANVDASYDVRLDRLEAQVQELSNPNTAINDE